MLTGLQAQIDWGEMTMLADEDRKTEVIETFVARRVSCRCHTGWCIIAAMASPASAPRTMLGLLLFAFGVVLPCIAQTPPSASTRGMAEQGTANPFFTLMTKAAEHARTHSAKRPLLSPNEQTVAPAAWGLPDSPATTVPVAQLQGMGIRIVPWTTNNPEKMRAIIRTGVDGLISDRPDLLQQVLAEERAMRPDDVHLKNFVVSAHRGGRGLRPENTLPSFESGLDSLATELETDTGVSTDGVSLIWHDQFYSPQSCRRADGTPYTLSNRTYIRDISSADAEKMFVCDKLHLTAFPDQKNDLALSPVAVAFAAKLGMPSPYAPTSAGQLIRFARFYVDFYTTGPGKAQAHAAERAANARTVHFNIETKLYPDDLSLDDLHKLQPGVPDSMLRNRTVAPQKFVDALAGLIAHEHMEDRASIQSFDFRTLQLVEEQYPHIQTFYLTERPSTLSTAMVPSTLRGTS